MPEMPAATPAPKRTRQWVGVAYVVGPSAGFLALYYSLAWHMYRQFHGWPGSIGTGGFSPGLTWHASLTQTALMVLVFQVYGFSPLALLVCGLSQRWRGAVLYLFLSGGVGFACLFWSWIGAPEGFLHWWHD